MARIVLDFGHGGEEHGAVFAGIKEKDVNRELGWKIYDYLENEHDIYMPQCFDGTVPLGERIKLINDWHEAEHIDLLVSIHHNAALEEYRGEWWGFKVYHHPNSSDGHNAAQLIIDEMVRATAHPYTDVRHVRWTRLRRLTTAELGRKVSIIHNTAPPAVLIEAGYLDNFLDRALIIDKRHQDSTACAIARGICKAVEEC